MDNSNEKKKIKYFIADANKAIQERLPQARILYPMATTNPDEPEGLWTELKPGIDYIAVGYKEEDIRWFKDWDKAVAYALTQTNKKTYLGIKEECDLARFTPVAVINEPTQDID